jgi:hypothetical protein
MMVNTDNGATERMSFWEALNASCGTRTDRRNQYWFLAWCIAWALTLVGASAFLKFNTEFRGTGAWILAVLPFAFSIGAVYSYLRYLRDADEFLRKVQIEGLAVGFGVGVLFTLGYQVLELAGAPRMSASDTVSLMIFGWVAGQLFATWRYR